MTISNRLEGKVALVTGAGRAGNIGVAVCEAFLMAGARAVIATDIHPDPDGTTANRLCEQFDQSSFRVESHDVTSPGDWARLVALIESEYGGLDVLVNNAGVSSSGGVASTPLEEMRRVMAVNSDGVFLGMQHCMPLLAQAAERFAGGGSIINTLSMSSYMANAHNIAYHASKASARMLTLCAATEFGPLKVRVNSVHPGVTHTPLLSEGLAQYVARGVWADEDEAERSIASMSPLGVSSQPESTAHAFVYLASEEARFVTGASIYHDGGLGQRY